ncbi:MAG: transcription-repair coupling factor [Clostridia bacterium]|nr:transcription-repair coupling factor [Clostridia bacterium]
MAVYHSITETIGNTPLVELRNFKRACALKAKVFAKLEYFNPAGSVKDRVALAMIEEAERGGRLKPGATIIEPTSGNTGIGLAAIGAAKGYHVLITMPETMSVERRNLIKACIKAQANKILKKGQLSHAVTILKEELTKLENSADIPFLDKYLPVIYPDSPCLFNYFDGLIMLFDINTIRDHMKSAENLLNETVAELIISGELSSFKQGVYCNSFDRIEAALGAMPSILLESFSRSHPGLTIGGEFSFRTRHIPSYGGNAALMREDLIPMVKNGYRVALLCANMTEAKNVASELCDEGISAGLCESETGYYGAQKRTYPVAVLYGESMAGFEMFGEKFAILDFSGSIFASGAKRKIRKNKAKGKKTKEILSYSDLTEGDYIVHEAYGIGQFLGIENMTIDSVSRDYVKIKYAGTDHLFLPVDQLDLVSKYIGAGADTNNVKLSKMGGADWHRAKKKASAAAKEMAAQLIQLYAARRRTKGFAFSPDDDMSRQFADAFEYEETDSQLQAIEDIYSDMEKEYPMDRILCGDVGYGKTEVALRAAFKAVNDGKQVAILVPTTILALQHFRTAISRFRGFPVTIDMLSRFRTKKQQELSLRKLARGETDIIIGTHRIISKDIEFHDLGLVIIDEEQRFGVAQKERLKEIAIGADMLTLSATPIPRTLNMAMGGILDMSVLDDVPGLRSPVQTYVCEHDEDMIVEAINRELRRGGQVFYLNNDVEYLYTLAGKLSKALPEARIAIAHGKLDREDLEDIWAEMTRGEIDILVCTTIIETGVDIPNANTLIIENADRFGLSQLHQIRGRVGRSSRRAYAYFTYPKMKQLTEIADKRLQALREYAAFGAGFKIAMRDLEIRGAGNLLGSEQHGNMESVGYDMYVKLLEEAVLEEKGTPKKPKAECGVSVKADAYIPKSYIKDQAQRMEMYRKIARIRDEEDFSDMIDELCDRYGEPPRAAYTLCRIALVRGLGITACFDKIEERDKEIMFTGQNPHLTAVQALANKYPGCVRMTLGSSPVVVVKKQKGKQAVDFICDLLTEYIQISSSLM